MLRHPWPTPANPEAASPCELARLALVLGAVSSSALISFYFLTLPMSPVDVF